MNGLTKFWCFLRSCLGQDWAHEGSRFICSIKKGENSGTNRRKMLHNPNIPPDWMHEQRRGLFTNS